MELKKFKKNNKYKRTLLALGIAGMCLGGGIILSKSYALYETKKEYNVIKGEVPDFGYDVKLAVIVDGEKKTDMPTNPVGKDGNYYNVQVDCTSSKTQGLWDYNAWRLNLDYIESNSKCNLTFTSNMSKADYDEYIKAGVALRRNTYRGKDITDYYTGDKKVNNRDLFQQIENGTFDDIYVGDYFKGKNGTIWLIADLDNYWHQGYKNGDSNYNKTGLNEHHATIIPSASLGSGKMNSSESNTGGYVGSDMYKSTLNNIFNTKIEPDFNNHIVTYYSQLSNDINSTLSNQYGQNSGASSGWDWYERKLDLMSEINVYGTIVWSSSGYDIGLDNRQYAIFKLKPEFINQDINGNKYTYWLKAVIDSQYFACVAEPGVSYHYLATSNAGIRPRFLIN